MLCTQEYKTEMSCYGSQLAEYMDRVERLGDLHIPTKEEKVSQCIDKTSLVSTIDFTKDVATFCFTKDAATVQRQG